jgi:hypothetical protein
MYVYFLVVKKLKFWSKQHKLEILPNSSQIGDFHRLGKFL